MSMEHETPSDTKSTILWTVGAIVLVAIIAIFAATP